MSRYWMDTEFIEYPHTIDLISIGIVDELGNEFYAESDEVDWDKASPWVVENVKPHLDGNLYSQPRADIAKGILDFAPPEDKPEFWGYYSAYDWVVFCWLFGTMMELPKGYPMLCRDIRQMGDQIGNPRLPQRQEAKHNALADAKWTSDAFYFLLKQGAKP